jgi:hypothetical protein
MTTPKGINEMASDVETGLLDFEAPNGSRMNYDYWGVTVMSGPRSWWGKETRRWYEDAPQSEPSSTHAPCRSVKAFRRHLRRHQSELHGCEVVLVSRWRGHNVTRPSSVYPHTVEV